MTTCEIGVLRIGSVFARKIRTAGPMDAKLAVDTLLEGLKAAHNSDNSFNTEVLARFVRAAAVTRPIKMGGMLKLSTAEEFEAYAESNRDVLAEATLASLEALPGFETLDNMIDTINIKTVIVKAVLESDRGDLERAEHTTVETEGAQISTTFLDNNHNFFIVGNTAIQKQRTQRIERTADLSPGSADSYAAFLDVYFPGASALGVEFTEFARVTLEGAIVDFTEPATGFTGGINNQMQRIKQYVKGTARALSSNTYSRKKHSLAEELGRDKGVQDRYFHEVLSADFTFIVESVLGTVTASETATKLLNSEVSGFSYSNGEVIDSVILDLSKVGGLFYADQDNEEVKIPLMESPTITKLPHDTLDFRKDKTLVKGAFYFLESDGEYFYRTDAGFNVKISPITAYEYNITNSARSSSIDATLESTDFSSGFVNNIFSMLRIVNYTATGEVAYGERLNKDDFSVLATRLINAGTDYDSFLTTLTDLAKGNNTRLSSIAHSVLLHIFEESPMSGIHSIRSASKVDSSKRGMNTMVVTSLYNSLTNFSYKRYMMWNEGVISVSRSLGDRTNDDTVNNGLSRYLVNNGYTKNVIAKRIVVKGEDIYYKDPAGRLFNITTLAKKGQGSADNPSIGDVAFSFGLDNLYTSITNGFVLSYGTTEEAENAAHSVFVNIIAAAAANKRKDAYATSDKKIVKHVDYVQVVPSHFIKGVLLDNMANAFNADTNKNLTTGGGKVPSTGPPNRDAHLPRQVLEYIKALEYSDNPMYYHPFLKNDHKKEDTRIIGATIGEISTKTDILHDGNIIKKSEWNEKIRVKYAFVTGMLRGVKAIGTEFWLQPVNYSDKGTPQMVQVFAEENLLSSSASMHKKLKGGFIEYQYEKYEHLQRTMISSLTDFIISDFSRLATWIESDGEELGQSATVINDRLAALRNLKEMLLYVDYPQTGDMTKVINLQMEKVGLDTDVIKYSHADLDEGADYVTMRDGKAVLKPHMGIRAELYRSEHAPRAVANLLRLHRKKIYDKLGITEAEILKELSYAKNVKKADIVTDADTFLDRVFLINGIYGHAIKTLTMGDESYFASFYEDAKGDAVQNISDYYEEVEQEKELAVSKVDGKNVYSKKHGFTYGLREVRIMLQNQFKRAQSELSEGISYIQQTTVRGLKIKSNKRDLLQHVDIKTHLTQAGPGSDIAEHVSYQFDSIVQIDPDTKKVTGKTFDELEGLGIMTRRDGALYKLLPSGHVVATFKVGREDVTVSSNPATAQELGILVGDLAFAEALIQLVTDINTLTVADKYHSEENVIELQEEEGPSVYTRENKESFLSLKKIKVVEKKISSNSMVTMPDYVPSILLEDPVSQVNLLNKAAVKQENSDAVQIIHPLLTLIQDLARGGKLGVFTTEQQEAMKFVTTTVEYDKARQSLQKKSLQNVFTAEQFRKLGSAKLYNMFKTMNTAVDFPQTSMRIRTTDSMGLDTFIVEDFKNLQELFEYLGSFSEGDLVWEKALNILIDNPINLYSFVGLLTLPSAQKTGRKKQSRYNDYFATKQNKKKPPLTYMANEFNFEILSKAHDTDVSGRLRKSSVIALLSQLANAVAFGGLSNNQTKNLQRSLRGVTEMSRVRIGDNFATIAMRMDPSATNVIDRLRRGDLSTGATFNKVTMRGESAFSGSELVLYKKVIREGIYDIAMEFDEALDSEILKDILNDENLSIDAPGVKRKIMNSLHSAFFTDSIKMKMPGFQGTVSATHNTISVFTAPSGRRTGRYGYIKDVLARGEGTPVTQENVNDFKDFVLPVDDVRVYNGVNYTVMLASTIDIDALVANSVKVEMVLTPDVLSSERIDLAEYDKLSPNSYIKVVGKNNKSATYYKWYFDKHVMPDEIATRDAMIQQGYIQKDLTEEYSLRWYQYSREYSVETTSTDGRNTGIKTKTEDLRDTKAYRDFYVASLNNESEEVLNGLRALLIVETQKKKEDGVTSYWDITLPEVVLPTFMRAAYNIPPGASLIDIIGTFGDPKANAATYFAKRLRTGKTYKTLSSDAFFLEKTRRIYSKKVIGNRSSFDMEVLAILNDLSRNAIARAHAAAGTSGGYAALTTEQKMAVNDIQIDERTKREINSIIESAKLLHVELMAENFMKTLNTVLTRIPGQSKQSGFAALVIEFLDSQGNATHAPTDHLTNTGGDLDIDTLSVLTKAIDAKGIIYDATDYIEDGLFVFDKMVTAYYKDVDTDTAELKRLVEESNESSKRLVEVREVQIAKLNAQDSKDVKELRKRNLQLASAKNNIVSEEQLADIIDYNRKRLYSKYLNVLANVSSSAIFSALSSVDTAVELNTPVTMSMFKPIMDRLESYKKQKPDVISGEDYGAIFLYEQLAAQGKESIGVFATVLKITSAIQYAKMNFDEFFAGDPNRDRDNDPFIFKHFLRYKSKLDGKNVVKVRTSFADLDRFEVMRKASTDSRLQNALFNNSRGAEHYEEEATALIVETIEHELKVSIQNTKNRKLVVSDSALKTLSNHYGIPVGNRLLTAFIEDADAGTVPDVLIENLQQMAGVKMATSVDQANFKRRVLGTFVDVSSTDQKAMLKSKAKDIFNIDIPKALLDSVDTLGKLSEYLTANPEIATQGIRHIIGAQLSNDAQSQFLSAATDNAKELILGRIGSNTVTNPIITTMMVLGYKADTIIDFLFDPQILELVNLAMSKKGNLEIANMTKSFIETAGVERTASVTSLLELIAIGGNISAFRAVRSLNENTEIEQSRLVNILGQLGGQELFMAILKNDMRDLKNSPEVRQGVIDAIFNPSIMTFLHDQSAPIFVQVYSTENSLFPAISYNSVIKRKIAGDRNNGEIAHKNINNYLSGKVVDSFLNKKMSVDGEERYRTGIIIDDKGVETVTELNTPENREAFVEQFANYYNHAQRILKENAALNSMVYGRTYQSVGAVLGIPKLKATNKNNIDIANIIQGIQELKTLTGDPLVDAVRKKIYNNFSNYALVVSMGEVKKGTMFEVFSEVNKELAAHVDSITLEEWRTFIPKHESVSNLVKGILMTTKQLEQYSKAAFINRGFDEYANGMEDSYRASGQETLANEEGNMFEEGLGELMQEEGFGSSSYTSYNLVEKAILPVVTTNSVRANKLFRIPNKAIVDAVFYGHKINEPAIRVFRASSAESNPYTSIPSTLRFPGMNAEADTFLEALTHAGYQLGLKVKYGSKSVRIFSYNGKTLYPNGSYYGMYRVLMDGELVLVPEVFLREYNPDLNIQGNIIRDKKSIDVEAYDKYSETLAALEIIPNAPLRLKNNASYVDYVTAYYSRDIETLNDFEASLIATSEAGLIGDVNVLVADTPVIGGNISYDMYKENKGIHRATAGHRKVLVPSLINDSEKERIITQDVNILRTMILENLNNLEEGEATEFYGWLHDDDSYAGGNNIVIDLFRGKYNNKGKSSFMNDAFSIETTTDPENSGIVITKITRNVGNAKMLLLGGKVLAYYTNIDEYGRATTDITTDQNDRNNLTAPDLTQIGMYNINNEVYEVPHKKISMEVNYQKVTILEVDRIPYIRIIDEKGFEGYYKMVSTGTKRAQYKVSRTDKHYGVPREVLSEVRSNLKNETIINNC